MDIRFMSRCLFLRHAPQSDSFVRTFLVHQPVSMDILPKRGKF